MSCNCNCHCLECLQNLPVLDSNYRPFNYSNRGFYKCNDACCLVTDSDKKMYSLETCWYNDRRVQVARPVSHHESSQPRERVYVPAPRPLFETSTPSFYSSEFGWTQPQNSFPVFVSNPSLSSFWSSGSSRSPSPPNSGGIVSRRNRY